MESCLDLATAIAVKQDGLVTAAQCRGVGLTGSAVDRLVRGRLWRPVFRGVYATSPGPLTDRQRIRAGSLAFGRESVIVLTSAARLHGWPVLPPDDEIHVSMPAALRRLNQPGLDARQLVIEKTDVMTIDGMRVTTPARTAADLLLRLSRFDAVSMLDAALHADMLTEPELDEVLVKIFGRRGAVAARRAVAAADRRAASPLESRVRIICLDGGVGPEELQYPVYDRNGVLLAIADMAWPSRGVLGEADGRSAHEAPSALVHDRRRQNELTLLGFIVVRFTWSDTLHPAYIVRVVREALSSGSPLSPSPTA